VTPHTLIIGAGIGGLTTAALLLKAGHKVTVLEAHVYAGGCAGTFYHKGYRFDAGATLAGGFAPGGPHARLAQIGAGMAHQPRRPRLDGPFAQRPFRHPMGRA
jgi:phytoene dehydrogenase-like protein